MLSGATGKVRKMETTLSIVALTVFPGGLFLLLAGLAYEWADRKLLAQFQNRAGPRWFQPLADVLKLLAKEEIMPDSVNSILFVALPIVALAGALTAALYVPMAGIRPAYSFPGDLVVTLYLLSLLTLCTGLAGANTINRFSVVGATRTLTQLIAYEAPFLLAMLGPALVAGSWQISEILSAAGQRWLLISQPLGFLVAVIGLMGKLEVPPFDAPEAETEVVAGALTEYSGRGLALFRLGKAVEMVIGLTLIAAFYLGGVNDPLQFVLKTVGLLLLVAAMQALLTRLRIDQTVGLWWRYGVLLILVQWLIAILGQGIAR
jgi:NADH-quinone oxidoreductase subunit H